MADQATEVNAVLSLAYTAADVAKLLKREENLRTTFVGHSASDKIMANYHRVRGLALRLVKLAEDVDTFAMQRAKYHANMLTDAENQTQTLDAIESFPSLVQLLELQVALAKKMNVQQKQPTGSLAAAYQQQQQSTSTAVPPMHPTGRKSMPPLLQRSTSNGSLASLPGKETAPARKSVGGGASNRLSNRPPNVDTTRPPLPTSSSKAAALSKVSASPGADGRMTLDLEGVSIFEIDWREATKGMNREDRARERRRIYDKARYWRQKIEREEATRRAQFNSARLAKQKKRMAAAKAAGIAYDPDEPMSGMSYDEYHSGEPTTAQRTLAALDALVKASNKEHDMSDADSEHHNTLTSPAVTGIAASPGAASLTTIADEHSSNMPNLTIDTGMTSIAHRKPRTSPVGPRTTVTSDNIIEVLPEYDAEAGNTSSAKRRATRSRTGALGSRDGSPSTSRESSPLERPNEPRRRPFRRAAPKQLLEEDAAEYAEQADWAPIDTPRPIIEAEESIKIKLRKSRSPGGRLNLRSSPRFADRYADNNNDSPRRSPRHLTDVGGVTTESPSSATRSRSGQLFSPSSRQQGTRRKREENGADDDEHEDVKRSNVMPASSPSHALKLLTQAADSNASPTPVVRSKPVMAQAVEQPQVSLQPAPTYDQPPVNNHTTGSQPANHQQPVPAVLQPHNNEQQALPQHQYQHQQMPYLQADPFVHKPQPPPTYQQHHYQQFPAGNPGVQYQQHAFHHNGYHQPSPQPHHAYPSPDGYTPNQFSPGYQPPHYSSDSENRQQNYPYNNAQPQQHPYQAHAHPQHQHYQQPYQQHQQQTYSYAPNHPQHGVYQAHQATPVSGDSTPQAQTANTPPYLKKQNTAVEAQ